MAFALNIYPWVYKAKFDGKKWNEEFEEKEHLTPQEEEALPENERNELLCKRNSFPELPLVNYTTQYALSCFEGLKVYPQKNGGMKIFRPDQNAERFDRSLKGLRMPGYDPGTHVNAIIETVKRNINAGFTIDYNPEWEKDNYINGSAIYVRPFSYTEGGIGINLSHYPWVIIICNPVSAYFQPGNAAAVTSDMVRATENGTGWIKSASNYVISMLAKKKAEEAGFMEALFLDPAHHEYLQEGSSCNFFCLLKNGTLVTPALGDTILPGITRKTVLQLAADMGIKTEERPLGIKEVVSDGKECFVTGTAAGVSLIDSITHNGKKTVYCGGRMGEVTEKLLITLKGIQYGALEDKYGWMYSI